MTGAADGYWRMLDRPAATLLHLGPGLGNGLANLHNAKKAHSGIVNIVGEHASYHIKYDAPLTADIEGIARPVSHWVKTSTEARMVAADGAEAIAVASTPPGQIATLILPGDTAWNEGSGPVTVPAIPRRTTVSEDAVQHAAKVLAQGAGTMLLLSGAGVRERGLALAGAIAHKTGARLMAQGSNARVQRGAGRVPVEPHPLPSATSVKRAQGCAAPDPGRRQGTRSLFWLSQSAEYFNAGGLCYLYARHPGRRYHRRTRTPCRRGGCQRAGCPSAATLTPAMPSGALDPDKIAALLGNVIPEQAVVIDESVTTGRGFYPLTAGAPPHDWLQNMGGSIGYGMPVAVGAALACPDRQVLALIGDGSGMYTVQALWTMAREGLNITAVIWANRTYQILKGEFDNVGAGRPGQKAKDMLKSVAQISIGWPWPLAWASPLAVLWTVSHCASSYNGG